MWINTIEAENAPLKEQLVCCSKIRMNDIVTIFDLGNASSLLDQSHNIMYHSLIWLLLSNINGYFSINNWKWQKNINQELSTAEAIPLDANPQHSLFQ